MINNRLIKIYSIIDLKCEHNGIQCNNKNKVLKIVSELAANKLKLNPQKVFRSVSSRERMGSTGIGNGIAIPHGILEVNIKNALGFFVKLEKSIAFDSVDNQPVDLIFALLIPSELCNFYFYELSLLVKKLTNKKICNNLRKAKSNKEMYKIFNEKENKLWILNCSY